MLGSLDLSRVVGLWDRAALGALAYTGARIGAIARLRIKDLQEQGAQCILGLLGSSQGLFVELL